MERYKARVIDDRTLELPQGALRTVRPGQEIEIDLADTAMPAILSNEPDGDGLYKESPVNQSLRTDRLVKETQVSPLYGREPTGNVATAVSRVDEFNALAEQWRREAGALSDTEKRAMHPAYQRIIGMGNDAIQ
jgi:hypothetical protein